MRALRTQLERWMKDCGDEGQATEMRALRHMTRNQGNNR
jgi:hypothetical protein